jgi:hypothetical protein
MMKAMRIGSFVSALALVLFMGAAAPAFAEDPVTTVTAGNTGSDALDSDLCKGANGFVSLSCIPGFAKATGDGGLAKFFNLLYNLAIGVGVVIAVLQLIRAGIMYMGSDSFTEKKDARNLIGATLLGLVLVLSPVLVLGIINPQINTLELNTSGLNVTSAGSKGLQGNISTAPAVGNNACQGFTKYNEAPVPSEKQCVDVNGPGWVTIDQVCCIGTQIPAGGYQCCALDPNYKPADTTPLPSQASYYDASKIPSGSWCYQPHDGGYVCGSDEKSCNDIGTQEVDPAISQCKKY